MSHQYGGEQPYGGGRRDEWGNPIGLTDEWGNPVHQRDEYGNPVVHHGTGGQSQYYANTTAPTGPVGGMAGDYGGAGQHHGTIGGMLHRSGSSSSSSSEDDGYGGRRKKGLKDKIKEKLPPSIGGQKHDYYDPSTGATTATTGGAAGYGYEEHHQKKGIMDKIKEKLPGGCTGGGAGGHH
ncbi:unnamed protein product [Cuscuta epithymum]|uniref:Dehydrin n=1 Tax=Cuscuta epithymum TaxID=186058 RepID=A0AAV0EDQ2_9ASTE|nr:unnamed protein product [Cuscuta epithymum]